MEYSTLSGQSPPSSASTFSKRNKFFLPLSNHGMPRTPLPSSPGNSIRSHRFGGLRSPRWPISPRADSLNSPLLSPPLSARSCNTFIESEPSTPACSPRAPSSNWDGSTLVLLSPQPTPSFPNEPEWEMLTTSRKNSDAMNPIAKRSTKDLALRDRAYSVDSPPTRIARSTSLSSHPPTPLALPKQTLRRGSEKREEKEGDVDKEIGKENIPPEDNSTSTDTAVLDEQTAATLGKLASRMKSMLRRKTVSEKKSDSRRRVREEDVDRMVSVHWSEM